MDASAILDLGERHYPERVPLFQPIWDFVYAGIESQTIITIDYVADEIGKKGDEWTTGFIQNAGRMFLISEEIEAEYASVVADLESNTTLPNNAHRDNFFSGADPWLIALARSRSESDVYVVSAERKPLPRYGLGAVCKLLGVRHLGIIEFFEINKIGG